MKRTVELSSALRVTAISCASSWYPSTSRDDTSSPGVSASRGSASAGRRVSPRRSRRVLLISKRSRRRSGAGGGPELVHSGAPPPPSPASPAVPPREPPVPPEPPCWAPPAPSPACPPRLASSSALRVERPHPRGRAAKTSRRTRFATTVDLLLTESHDPASITFFRIRTHVR